ncbi:hypothetical protein [Burkholderia latens]|uniref:Fimbrial assembly protein n=1 Tax=Burkholderia latens TaxID=488446 RepID=A0A6H9SSR2_9BURK|nr:hypothetical protein [Burkholderia latens]KAB0643437.1 hypothetical protein F7R21_07080 [Burkholderia latens]VWB13374.1 hypothetical protein BLA24064_00453 [Burkholderia latens]
MKKLALAVAASACALSAYAGNPKPIDLNVRLAGQVPPQGVFEVTAQGWESGYEAKFNIGDGWSGSEKMEHMPVKVKSSYGAVHLKLTLTSGGESMTTGNWYLAGEDRISKIGVRRRVLTAEMNFLESIEEEKVEVASKDVAAKGGEIQLILGIYFNKDIPVKRGMTYKGVVSAVFETALDE